MRRRGSGCRERHARSAGTERKQTLARLSNRKWAVRRTVAHDLWLNLSSAVQPSFRVYPTTGISSMNLFRTNVIRAGLGALSFSRAHHLLWPMFSGVAAIFTL